jgi:hypothetical protein
MIGWRDEMAVDAKLEQELTDQIKLLEKLQLRVGEAIGRAKGKLEKVQDGKSRVEVFPRKKPVRE